MEASTPQQSPIKTLRIFKEISYAVLATTGEYHADFAIYKISGYSEGDTPGVFDRPEFSKWEEHVGSSTDNIEEADVFAHGSVKWDGCSNWYFDEQDRVMLHGCDRADLANIGRVLAACYDMAAEFCKHWSKEEAVARNRDERYVEEACENLRKLEAGQ